MLQGLISMPCQDAVAEPGDDILWTVQIVAVVLVELPDAPVQFRETTSLLLDRINPSAMLTVVPAEKKQR